MYPTTPLVFLLVLLSRGSALAQDQPKSPGLELLEPEPKEFSSADEVADYLAYLNQYFQSVSRPRFCKREAGLDTPEATAKYIRSLNHYLHSISRPRFGKRDED